MKLEYLMRDKSEGGWKTFQDMLLSRWIFYVEINKVFRRGWLDSMTINNFKDRNKAHRFLTEHLHSQLNWKVIILGRSYSVKYFNYFQFCRLSYLHNVYAMHRLILAGMMNRDGGDVKIADANIMNNKTISTSFWFDYKWCTIMTKSYSSRQKIEE